MSGWVYHCTGCKIIFELGRCSCYIVGFLQLWWMRIQLDLILTITHCLGWREIRNSLLKGDKEQLLRVGECTIDNIWTGKMFLLHCRFPAAVVGENTIWWDVNLLSAEHKACCVGKWLWIYIHVQQEHIRMGTRMGNSNETPYCCQNYWTVIKIEHVVTCLATSSSYRRSEGFCC